MNKTFFLLVVIAAMFTGCGLQKQPAIGKHLLKTQNHHIVNGYGDTILLRGMGLGGWMLQEGYMFKLGFIGQQYRIREHIEDLVGAEETEKFYDAWLDLHTRKADIDSMAALGFNSIRLPMHYNLYTLAVEDEPVAGEQTWLEQGFAMTDSLLAWCKVNEIYLILDLHAAPGGQGHDLNISDRNPDKPSFWESEANRQKTIALWRKLAERYADEEWIGGYDVLNETNWGFEDPEDRLGVHETKNVPLKEFLVQVTQAIREVDTNHIVFLEGNGFANNYRGIVPDWDDNMVLSFHKYGNPNTKASIQQFLDLREKYNIPLWLGESGENSNTWFTEAIVLCEAHGIGWAWWQNKKMGINQPWEIEKPEGYDRLLSYWKGEGEKPSKEETLHTLNAWLDNLKLENNNFRADVVDAMFRQVESDDTRPFKNRKYSKGDVIQAVDFDLGKQGFAYLDKDTASYHFTPGMDTQGNRGWSYRNDGVDIKEDTAGYYVFHIEDGEWLQYTVDIVSDDIDRLLLHVADPKGSGRIRVSINDVEVDGIVYVPQTTDETDWTHVSVPIADLKQGENMIKITAEKGGFTFKALGL